MIPRRAPESTLLAALMLLVPLCVQALPEDAEQPMNVDYLRLDIFLNEGVQVYTGSREEPACITQGSLKICGVEIRVEQGDDGELKQVTATGTPARFQQQPAANQELVHASGATLVFDNTAQVVTADGDAELSQKGIVFSHQHIEYDIDSGHVSANGAEGERGQVSVPPTPASN